MLRTSPMGVVRNSIEEEYCKRVTVRRGLKRWTLPKRWNNEIGRIARFLAERRIDSKEKIAKYVESQFIFWGVNRCEKLFKMKYPPLPILRNDRSIYRYERHEYSTQKVIEETIVDIKRRVSQDISGLNRIPQAEVMAFMLLSDCIAMTSFAVMYVRDMFDKEYAIGVLSIVNEAVPGSIDRYNNALYKALKTEGRTDGAKYAIAYEDCLDKSKDT